MARYLLVGAVGGPNFGDELILSTWINIIRKRDTSAQIFCDGYNLDNLKLFVKGRADVVNEMESLWRVGWVIRPESKHNIWTDIREKSKKNDNNKLIVDTLNALQEKKFDQIHIIGGGYINNIWPDNYMILLLTRLLAWQTGARLIATGLGLVPTGENDLLGLCSLLKTFDFVDVRDEESYNLLKEIHSERVTYTGDDVLLLLSEDTYNYPIQKIKDKSLVLCLQNDLFEGDMILEKIFVPKTIQVLKKNSINKIVIAMAMKDDVSLLSNELKLTLDRLNINIVTVDPGELLRDGFPVSDEGVIFTSRYHPHFLGALSGFKGIAISSTNYYDIKHKAVHSMGSNWPVLNANELVSSLPELLEILLTKTFVPYNFEAKNRFIKLKIALIERVFALSAPRCVYPVDFLGWGKDKFSIIEDNRVKSSETVEHISRLIMDNSELYKKVDQDAILIDKLKAQVQTLREVT